MARRATVRTAVIAGGLALIVIIVAVAFTRSSGGGTKTAGSAGTGDGYWHTKGGTIVDGEGRAVRIAGVNWFGFETSTFVAHGLWVQNYQDMLEHIKALEYNTVRLPYSSQMFDDGSV